MSNWLMFVLGAVGMWVLLGAVYGWMCECSSRGLENILEIVLSLPWVILAGVAVVVWYPFFCLWKFFRNAIKPVSQQAWDKCHFENNFLAIGNFRIVYDKKARALCNKLFLVRIAKPADEVQRDPIVIYSDEPSSPKGEFRIGENGG